jgi:hypothetical protein
MGVPRGLYSRWSKIKSKTSSDGGSSNNNKTAYQTYEGLGDYSNLMYSSGGSSSGRGGYDVAKADISGLLAAYDQQADSARQVAETKYNNTRNDLLTSLKRFQEQNAKDVANQKQGYLSEQANLESAREQANRQNRISASARGIGGSGLQQLAQLQNLMGQSAEVSQAANKNQTAMDKLATLLREYEEDNATKMQRNEDERTSTLNSIASTLASQKAQAIAENEQRYVNALNSARAQAAAASASSGASTNYGTILTNLLDSTNVDLRKLANSSKAATIKSYAQKAGLDLSDVKDSKITKNASEYKQQIAKAIADNTNTYIQNAVQENYLTGNSYNTMKNDINSMLKAYGFYRYY